MLSPIILTIVYLCLPLEERFRKLPCGNGFLREDRQGNRQSSGSPECGNGRGASLEGEAQMWLFHFYLGFSLVEQFESSTSVSCRWDGTCLYCAEQLLLSISLHSCGRHDYKMKASIESYTMLSLAHELTLVVLSPCGVSLRRGIIPEWIFWAPTVPYTTPH